MLKIISFLFYLPIFAAPLFGDDLKKGQSANCVSRALNEFLGLEIVSDSHNVHFRLPHGASFKFPVRYLKAIEAIQTGRVLEATEFTTRLNALEHLDRHGPEFGAYDVKEYTDSAVEFARSNNPNTLFFWNAEGNRGYKFDPRTKKLLVVNNRGQIITYYLLNPRIHRAGDNMTYFLRQYERE